MLEHDLHHGCHFLPVTVGTKATTCSAALGYARPESSLPEQVFPLPAKFSVPDAILST